MENHFVQIRKGLQKEVLFLGLKAKYINYCIYIGLGIIAFGFGLSIVISTALALVFTACLMLFVFAILLFYSKTYGANGFLKKIADKSKPKKIRVSNSFSKMLIWKKE
ncbi:DUF4133 domain-containing protein [Flaviramulus basaltis]|uniref:DUF4133 domain-containing protein n=1 Tax=Flaviramulus basaltis TaxID=369401 RepID=UPI000931E8D8|tara:strand:+ start:22183 stop:22506 length:324 start_codon:yes stop_codon:yes gene_type:complete